MDLSNCVVSLLAFMWFSSFCGASGSLDCTFKDGFCDWNQTVKQCSWIFSPSCAFNTSGCVYVTDNSGSNCSSVGLRANIKRRGNRGIYFEYFMTSPTGGSLRLKDNVGSILWSCSQLPAPQWYSAQILLQKEQNVKAIIIEANFDPGSGKYIAVKSVKEAEKMEASTSCSSYVTDSTPSTGIHTTLTTTEILETTEEKEEDNTHAQTRVGQVTQTNSNNPSESDISTRTNPVSAFPDPTPKTHHGMSVNWIAAIVTGIICSVPLIGIVIYFIVKGTCKNKPVYHISKSVHMNPVFMNE